MEGLHVDGCKNAMVAAQEEFDSTMNRYKSQLKEATSAEAEEAIQQQMRQCEARHRDLISSLQRSVF
ncbi:MULTISPECIES: hypothetical protein [Bremerella]|uniref:hypothetical protein n=1 Tax=Bremerella TaxID=2714594 RepID=UPI0031EC3E2D